MGVGGEHIGLSPVSSPTVTRCDGLLEEVEGIFLQLSHSANSFEYSLHTRHCIRLWGHGSERQMLFLSTHSSPSDPLFGKRKGSLGRLLGVMSQQRPELEGNGNSESGIFLG